MAISPPIGGRDILGCTLLRGGDHGQDDQASFLGRPCSGLATQWPDPDRVLSGVRPEPARLRLVAAQVRDQPASEQPLLVQVPTVAQPATEVGAFSGLRLLLPRGLQLEINQGFDAATLGRVITTLEAGQ